MTLCNFSHFLPACSWPVIQPVCLCHSVRHLVTRSFPGLPDFRDRLPCRLQSWPKVRRTTKQICKFLIYLGFKIILHLPPLPPFNVGFPQFKYMYNFICTICPTIKVDETATLNGGKGGRP